MESAPVHEHSVPLDSELVMSHSHSSSPAVDCAESFTADCAELSSDMSAIIKQLVFSPEKEEEQEREAVSQVQQEAVAEVVEDAVQQIDAPVAAAVEAVAEAEPVAVEATAEVESVPVTDDASMAAPIAIAAAEPDMEAALEATIVPSSPLPVAAAVATVAPADADDADEDVTAFPTFATAVEDEQMSYVSAEMKTQELLLLSARDQSASTSSSRRMSRSGASSGTATPRSNSSVRQAESAARLSAPSYSASKRRAASATPQSRRREVESAVAAVALLRGSVKKPAPQPEKRKLTLASSPKLTTRTRTHSSTTLSSEEAELLRMRVERSALKKLQELNAKKLDSVLHSADASDLLPVRSTKSLTQPQELKLRTAGRSKTRTPVVEEAAPVAKKAAHAFVAGQLTQAKPFAFQTDGRARSSSVSASRSAHASTSVAPSATPSRSASRSTSRAPSRSVSRSVSRASSRAGSRAGSRATSPSRSVAASSTAAPALTQPKEFNFATSKRAKAPTPAAEPTPVKKERASMLSAGGLTQPKPFALLTDMRAPLPATPAASGSSFVSLANQTANWLGSGHDRVVSAPTMGAAGASQLTAPREFHFHTHERKPSAPVLSSEERAMAEAEAAKLALKAEKEAALKAALAPSHRPLESFRAPSTLTQIQPFHLTEVTPRPREDKAALEAAAVEKEREERRRRVLASSKANGVTVAQAPTLAVLQRVPLKEHAPPAEVPKPVAVTTGPTSLTIPAPFELSTDVRGASKQDAFSAKLAAEAAAAKAAASFHAAPMPAEGAPTFVPQVPHRRVLADLQPNLRSVALHEQSSKQFAAQLAAEKALDREQRTFVAKPLPATILSQPAFVPKPSAKQLTAPEEPTFNSEQRAERRAQLEREQAVRQAAADKMRQEAEAVRRKEEAEEMKKFRASLVIHAKPVPLSSQAPR